MLLLIFKDSTVFLISVSKKLHFHIKTYLPYVILKTDMISVFLSIFT